MSRLTRPTLVVAAIAGVAIATMLPARRTVVTAEWRPTLETSLVRGAFHMHTQRSDGSGTVEDVARAAARARLDFVILTDHGDGLRTPDPPRYLGNVLVVDAVEVSTRLGHIAVLGLDRVTPTRLAGWPDEVVEDARRYGGRGIVTHPDSARRSLSWRDWTVPVEAFEWINADSEWRDEGVPTLLRSAISYPLRPVEAISLLLDRPQQTLQRWDTFASQGRFLVTIAGADAHARIGPGDEEYGLSTGSWGLRLPTYEHVFRVFSTHVELDRPWTGDAAADAATLIDAVFEGRTYTVIDGVAGPARLEFYATGPSGLARMGARLRPGTPVTLEVRANAPAGARVRLLRNGRVLAESTGLGLSHPDVARLEAGERGASFRVEVDVPRAPGIPPVPWIVSNPIFVGEPARATPEEVAAVGESATSANDAALVGIDLRACVLEKDSLSSAALRAAEDGDQLDWDYRLAGDPGAWVAIACPAPGDFDPASVLQFAVRGTRPVRLSVQVRARTGSHRWARSFHVGGEWQPVRARVDAMRPVGSHEAARPGGEISHVLLVLDRTHGTPGMQGQMTVRELRVGPPAAGQVRTVSNR